MRLEIEGLRNEMNKRDETLAALRIELVAANESFRASDELRAEVKRLQEALKVQATKAKRFLPKKCELLLVHEMAIEVKEEAIVPKDAVISRDQSELEGQER